MRGVMVRAARAAGVAPVALSFVGVLWVWKQRLTDPRVGRSTWWRARVEELGQPRLPPRRKRQLPAGRKTTRSRWPVKKEHHQQGPLPTLTLINVANP